MKKKRCLPQLSKQLNSKDVQLITIAATMSLTTKELSSRFEEHKQKIILIQSQDDLLHTRYNFLSLSTSTIFVFER